MILWCHCLTSPLLHPQKLIRLCALPGSNTEKEEAQFLLVVCSRVKQDPHTLRLVLEVNDRWQTWSHDIRLARTGSDCFYFRFWTNQLPGQPLLTSHKLPLTQRSHHRFLANQIHPPTAPSNQNLVCCRSCCNSPRVRSVYWFSARNQSDSNQSRTMINKCKDQ